MTHAVVLQAPCQDEWLNDAAGGNSIAATVLSRYKPLEPEMALQMFGARFRQWFVTTEARGKRDFIVPWPEKPTMPKEVELYMKAEWACNKISLLDFLRKSTGQGTISAWLKKLHTASTEGQSLHQFARNYAMQGEKVVAADCLSRLNDLFYGQWLMLHVPFKQPEDFFEPMEEKLARVPQEHRNFAMALLCDHPVAQSMWHSEAAVEAELRQEALSKPFVKTLQAMVAAHKTLVQKYITGEANAEQEAKDRAAGRKPEEIQGPAEGFNHQQDHIKARVDGAVDRFLAVQATANETEADELVEEAFKDGKIFVCTGGPGTGKTTVALSCVHRALELGGQVLFAYPTNRQASRMRAKLPEEVQVDTYHAAFGLDEEPGTMAAALAQYALVAVDEVSQMQQKHFEHVAKLWTRADNLPAVLMCGDELQMCGYGEERAWHSPMWRRMVFRVKLHQVYRCKDPDFNAILQELRTSRPCKATWKELRKHKAWAPPHKPPTVEGMQKLLKAHPNTVILTCTRKGQHTMNEVALKALFPRHPPLVVLPADMDSNPENYDEAGKLLTDVFALKPAQLPLFKGMRVVFTRNVRKDIDYVNGMDATVVAYHKKTKAVEVLTQTNFRVMVWPWTDVERGNATYYPLKAGYADTILKFQGADLPHVTVILDAKGVIGPCTGCPTAGQHRGVCMLAEQFQDIVGRGAVGLPRPVAT